ncbi:MAG: hypothetical protein PVI82_16850 [Desulfobacterales bacterium]|jgi:hypothetical protein
MELFPEYGLDIFKAKVKGFSVQMSIAGLEGSTFKGLGWLLAACFLLLADLLTSSQEPEARSQRK